MHQVGLEEDLREAGMAPGLPHPVLLFLFRLSFVVTHLIASVVEPLSAFLPL